LPRSRLARKGLAEELRARGAKVLEADAYDAVPAEPDLASVRRERKFDFVLLTSASAANNLATLLPDDLRKRLIDEAGAVCIGPIAAEAARSLGFRVRAIAREHTVPGHVECLLEVQAHGRAPASPTATSTPSEEPGPPGSCSRDVRRASPARTTALHPRKSE